MKRAHPAARTRARELALQALYQIDLAGADPVEALAHAAKSEEDPPGAEALGYADQLVRGVVAQKDALDRVIEAHSHNWRIDRMARVDRNVLRLAVWELRENGAEVPRKVVLNEAIELAKKFGTEESGAFINGILDKIGTAPSK